MSTLLTLAPQKSQGAMQSLGRWGQQSVTVSPESLDLLASQDQRYRHIASRHWLNAVNGPFVSFFHCMAGSKTGVKCRFVVVVVLFFHSLTPFLFLSGIQRTAG